MLFMLNWRLEWKNAFGWTSTLIDFSLLLPSHLYATDEADLHEYLAGVMAYWLEGAGELRGCLTYTWVKA